MAKNDNAQSVRLVDSLEMIQQENLKPIIHCQRVQILIKNINGRIQFAAILKNILILIQSYLSEKSVDVMMANQLQTNF